tara:strand:+ start:789 stop:1097 length:309 start_codon:yes stop_codon:yes gene_type:complete
METILTVLITLGVVALAFAVRGVIRLSRRVNDLELLRMEIVDFEGQFEKQIEREQQDRQLMEHDAKQAFDEWNASIDRRFDKLWTDVHKLDVIINPNKDIVN